MDRRLISEESERLIKKENCFDVLRYCFSLTIFINHFSDLTASENILFFVRRGEIVSDFFILSGFLVVYGFIRKPELKTYLMKRVRRIFPMYFAVVAISIIAGILITSLPMSEYLQSTQLYKYALANFSFLNFLEPCLPGVFTSNPEPFVNGSLWSLKVELALYLSVPITFYFLKRYNKFWL